MRRSAFLGVLAAAGCAHRRAAIEPFRTALPGVRIVALGDSLAFGTGASSPEHAFIFRAYERVRERRPASEIANFAMGGSTARDVLRLQMPRLAGTRFDIVVLCVGGNDVVRRIDPSLFGQTYARMLDAIRRLQPAARIVCCGVPNVGISPLFSGLDHAAVTQLARRDDDAVRAAARARGDAFVDLFAVTTSARGDAARFLSDDRFHPGDAGYAQLAGALAPALLRAADERPAAPSQPPS
jgi:lysophospholipase L1-like esterase